MNGEIIYSVRHVGIHEECFLFCCFFNKILCHNGQKQHDIYSMS